MSQRYGGIHFEEADRCGRELGARVACRVLEKAQWYFKGMSA
jgi:hypothetical protein